MGQVIARDLGLVNTQEEEQKEGGLRKFAQDLMKKQQEAQAQMGEDGEMVVLPEAEIEDDDEDDDDDEDVEEDGDYEDEQMEDDDEMEGEEQQEDSDENLEVLKAMKLEENGMKDDNQFKRPFQSIQLNEYFGNQDDDEDENDGQDMLGDMSDDGDDFENSFRENNQQEREAPAKSRKRTHNIRDEVGSEFHSNSHKDQNYLSGSPQIRFHHAIDKDQHLSESEESSQFGPVFSSSEDEEIKEDKNKGEEINSDRKKGTVKGHSRSSSTDKKAQRNSYETGNNFSVLPPKGPLAKRTTLRDGSTQGDEYQKYLAAFFPDQKE